MGSRWPLTRQEPTSRKPHTVSRAICDCIASSEEPCWRGVEGWWADHLASVATTWSLSFEQVEKSSPVAADLLRVCAFLHPDAIPEEMLSAGAPHLGLQLEPLATDELAFNEAISAL